MERHGRTNMSDSFYGKFVKNQKKIRNLAIADPDSYAAVVVKAADHFFIGSAMIREHLDQPLTPCCTTAILREFAHGLRASELFAAWTMELLCKVKSIAGDAIESEGLRSSSLDRNARMCYGMLMIHKDDMAAITAAIKFIDESRKKYPTEIFFHRTYCNLFSLTKEWEIGFKASDEACKRFPNNVDLLNIRASMLRMMTDKACVDYTHWSKLKKQVEDVKQAFKDFLEIAPKDHRHFADNNYLIAYFAFKYASPSSKMMDADIQEISLYYQKGVNAEQDILLCFLPYTSDVKKLVAKHVNFEPPVNIYHDGNTCTVDMTTKGMPGRPKTGFIPTENMTFISIRSPTKRRTDMSVAHRRRLEKMVCDPAIASLLTQPTDDQYMGSVPSSANDDCDDYEELILYQLTMHGVSKKFTSKVFPLTVVEDSLYDSGYLETIVADTTGDVIKLQMNLGEERPENHLLMLKFRFGTVWKLRNPDFFMENGDESTMLIRATPECLIPVEDSQNANPKCRMCFKPLNPGKKCAKCKLAAYCGKNCQVQDWKHLKHNLICSEAYMKFYK